jgi:hypothetical protein
MARPEVGDEMKLKLGSLEMLVTITSEIEGVGPGVYTMVTEKGHQISADESLLHSKFKSVPSVLEMKLREMTIRSVYSQITGKSGDFGHGPADLIVEFLG